jgi:hypothetical protein
MLGTGLGDSTSSSGRKLRGSGGGSRRPRSERVDELEHVVRELSGTVGGGQAFDQLQPCGVKKLGSGWPLGMVIGLLRRRFGAGAGDPRRLPRGSERVIGLDAGRDGMALTSRLSTWLGDGRQACAWGVRRERVIDAMAAAAAVLEPQGERAVAPSSSAPTAGENPREARQRRPGRGCRHPPPRAALHLGPARLACGRRPRGRCL